MYHNPNITPLNTNEHCSPVLHISQHLLAWFTIANLGKGHHDFISIDTVTVSIEMKSLSVFSKWYHYSGFNSASSSSQYNYLYLLLNILIP